MATVKLTDRQVAASKAQDGERLELWDVQTPGLALRVTDRGRKTWIVRYRTADGRQPRFTLGTYPDMPLAEARDAAADAIRMARRGGDPAAERQRAAIAARTEPLKTLEDLAASYFGACERGEWRPKGKKKRASTLEQERRSWRVHIQPELGGTRVEEVGADAIKRLLRTIVANGHGVTANRVRSLVRQMLNYAISEERIQFNPVAKVPALGVETPRDRILSDAELKATWAAIKDPSLLRIVKENAEPERVFIAAGTSIAFRVLLLTMTRRAEVAEMRADEVDLDRATWLIPGERTKNGRPHLVPLAEPTVALINEAMQLAAERAKTQNLDRARFVFPSPWDVQKSITPGALSHALRDVRLALNLPRFTPHDLRRTAATLMASERLGISPFLIGRILNHSTETGGAAAVTLNHYALHDYAAEKRRALASWAELLAEIVGEARSPNALLAGR